MTALIVVIHIVVSIALILIVLLQTGKGADMGAVFGGAGSQTIFGSSGATTFLGKLTTAAAVVFMITSLSLAYISKNGGKSVVSDMNPPVQQTQTAIPQKQLPATGEASSTAKQSTPATEGAVPNSAAPAASENATQNTGAPSPAPDQTQHK